MLSLLLGAIFLHYCHLYRQEYDNTCFFEQLMQEPIAYKMCIAFMSLCLPAPWDASFSMANQEQLSVILAVEKS